MAHDADDDDYDPCYEHRTMMNPLEEETEVVAACDRACRGKKARGVTVLS